MHLDSKLPTRNLIWGKQQHVIVMHPTQESKEKKKKKFKVEDTKEFDIQRSIARHNFYTQQW